MKTSSRSSAKRKCEGWKGEREKGRIECDKRNKVDREEDWRRMKRREQ